MQDLQAIIHYQFKKQALLRESLRHASVVFDLKKNGEASESSESALKSNERLEYLGDAVVDLYMSERLYSWMPEADEGTLSRCRSQLVNRTSLASKAHNVGLDKYLELGRSQVKIGINDSLMADAFEAVVGALYLDGGTEVVFNFLDRQFTDDLSKIAREDWQDKDYKTLLQEVLQGELKKAPYYKELSSTGKDHEKIFTVAAFFEGRVLSKGSGASKKLAQQSAAKVAYQDWLLKKTDSNINPLSERSR